MSYSALRSVVLQVSLRNVEGEKKLRKDLKRTKVLLADAQIMLDHLKSNAPSKREITQLKNQVCGRSSTRRLFDYYDLYIRIYIQGI